MKEVGYLPSLLWTMALMALPIMIIGSFPLDPGLIR